MTREELINYFRSSLALETPGLGQDEAYDYTDEELIQVLEIVAPIHNPRYSLKSFPKEELLFLILLGRREVYYHLATASAPFYPLEAEGASLRKDYRFEHYMALIRRADIDYERLWKRFQEEGGGNGFGDLDDDDLIFDGKIVHGNVLSKNTHFTQKGYNLAKKPKANISEVVLEEASIGLSWAKFKALGGIFGEYRIYISEDPIYDKFESSIADSACRVFSSRNIHDRVTRITEEDFPVDRETIKEFKPLETSYHIALLVFDVNGMFGVEEILTEVEKPEEPEKPTEKPDTPTNPKE